MDHFIQVPLNLPDVHLLWTQRTAPGHWLIGVESPRDGAQCRRCGRELRGLQGWEAVVRLRHLPRFDVPVVPEIRPQRSRGPSWAGHPTTTPQGAWDEPRSPHTQAYAPWALRMVLNSTVADAARKRGGSEETIDGIRARGIERAVDGDAWERLGVLGLDAIALTRGPRAWVVLVTVPREEGGLERVAVRVDRTPETVAACLGARPEPLRRTVARACTAMDAGSVRASKEEVPGAAIGIERCHVARASRDGADTGRPQERKRLKRAWPKAADAALTGALGPFRQRPGALEPQAGALLERLFTASAQREAASDLREDLTARFERASTKAGATCAIRAWGKRVRQRGRAECERLLGTLERGLDEITPDFQGRQTSGLVAGFNNRVKGLTRRGDGICNVGRRFQRLTRDWHGYQRFGHP